MGLSIVFTGAPDGGDGPFALASASGWALFAGWAAALPDGEFPAVRALGETGEVAGTDALAAQLAGALGRRPPDNPAVADTARKLLDNLGVGDPDESAVVTDGPEPEDDPDAE